MVGRVVAGVLPERLPGLTTAFDGDDRGEFSADFDVLSTFSPEDFPSGIFSGS